jgi:hypothetical protein
LGEKLKALRNTDGRIGLLDESGHEEQLLYRIWESLEEEVQGAKVREE